MHITDKGKSVLFEKIHVGTIPFRHFKIEDVKNAIDFIFSVKLPLVWGGVDIRLTDMIRPDKHVKSLIIFKPSGLQINNFCSQEEKFNKGVINSYLWNFEIYLFIWYFISFRINTDVLKMFKTFLLFQGLLYVMLLVVIIIVPPQSVMTFGGNNYLLQPFKSTFLQQCVCCSSS